MRAAVLILLISSTAVAEVCPDIVPTTGVYVNQSDSWPFSIVIPAGYEGLWNSAACVQDGDDCACMGDHGRIIPLSSKPWTPQRHIEVFAGYNATDTNTLAGEMRSHIESRRDDGQIRSVSIRRIILAGRRGRRAVIRYFDTKLKLPFVNDVVIIGTHIQFTLELVTRARDYSHDRPLFEAVLKSWRPL